MCARATAASRNLGFASPGPVLEVVLEDFCRERWAHLAGLARFRAFGADYFSSADYFGRGQACDFHRQHQVDFQLGIRLKSFLGVEEHTRAAYVFGGAGTPAFFPDLPIAQRQLQVEAARTKWRNLFLSNVLFDTLSSSGSGLTVVLHHDLLRDGF